jgi:trans-2,3-dihydro-3-hydroxyanthranilate isomerase
MFAPFMGMNEDPATGSAVAALAGLIAAHEPLDDGEHRFAIQQGYEMGRTSLIELTFTLQQKRIVAASIGGSAVLISEGEIEA